MILTRNYISCPRLLFSQRMKKRTETWMPALAGLCATSSRQPSWNWGLWELREQHQRLLYHLQTIAEFTTLSLKVRCFFHSSLCFPTGWNLQLEIGPWIIFGWSNGTTSVITCWRASTLTLDSVSQTAKTPVSTFMSSPSCLRAWVSHFNQVTLITKNSLCDLQCL